MSTTYPIFKEVGEEAFKLVLNRNGNEVTYRQVPKLRTPEGRS